MNKNLLNNLQRELINKDMIFELYRAENFDIKESLVVNSAAPLTKELVVVAVPIEMLLSDYVEFNFLDIVGISSNINNTKVHTVPNEFVYGHIGSDDTFKKNPNYHFENIEENEEFLLWRDLLDYQIDSLNLFKNFQEKIDKKIQEISSSVTDNDINKTELLNAYRQEITQSYLDEAEYYDILKAELMSKIIEQRYLMDIKETKKINQNKKD